MCWIQKKLSLTSEEDFEKLILAYDLSTRKNSKYKTLEEDAETIEKNGYRYPALKFVRRHYRKERQNWRE